MAHRYHTWPRCQATGKRRLRTHKDVRIALVNATHSRAHAEQIGFETRNRVVRGYRCEACGGWHLTNWGASGSFASAA